MPMLFWDILLLITLSCEFRVHRAGSKLKMSERQTGRWEPQNFENIKNDPWDTLNAEQLLFSCLCSKVAVYCRKLQCCF